MGFIRATSLSLVLIAGGAAFFAVSGCTGHLTLTDGTDVDSGGLITDMGGHPVDGGTMMHVDMGPLPPVDGGGPPPVDLGPPPPVDLGPPPPVDLGPPPPVDMGMLGMCSGGPLALPIAGCMPATPPTTGDPHQDCVNRINQFRYQCQCLPPLMRWTAGEACADQDAMYDQMHMSAHAGFIAGICGSGYGENECPGWLGWGSVSSTISSCLQQMWDEGPGDFYGPPEHGHYINMSSTSFTMVACGFYTSGGQTTAAQNFQ